jgi:predicted Zn-dependent protease
MKKSHQLRKVASAILSVVSMVSLEPVALASPDPKASKTKSSVYDQAKASMSEDLYPAYRLLDRIMSANLSVTQKATIGMRSVDQATCSEILGDTAICGIAADLPDVQRTDSFFVWALQVASAAGGKPNAYASSFNNRIILNRSLNDAFDGSLSAKACVIAHELAHIQKDHSKSTKQALQAWNDEAAAKISSATINARKAQNSSNFWNALAMVANAANAGLNSGMGNYGLASLANSNNQMLANRMAADSIEGQIMVGRIMQAAKDAAPQVYQSLAGLDGLSGRIVERTMKDVRSYLGEVNLKAAGLSREQEYEADEMAVQYLANAGINPKGCLEMITILHRGTFKPIAKDLDTHPGESERRARIEQAIVRNEAAYRSAVLRSATISPLAYRYDERQELVSVFPRSVVSSSSGGAATVDRFLSDPDAARRDAPFRKPKVTAKESPSKAAAAQQSDLSVDNPALSAYKKMQIEREKANKRYAEMQEFYQKRSQ